MLKRRKRETVERWRVTAYRDMIYQQARQMDEQATQEEIITFRTYLQGQRNALQVVAKYLSEFVLQEDWVHEEKPESPEPV